MSILSIVATIVWKSKPCDDQCIRSVLEPWQAWRRWKLMQKKKKLNVGLTVFFGRLRPEESRGPEWPERNILLRAVGSRSTFDLMRLQLRRFKDSLPTDHYNEIIVILLDQTSLSLVSRLLQTDGQLLLWLLQFIALERKGFTVIAQFYLIWALSDHPACHSSGFTQQQQLLWPVAEGKENNLEKIDPNCSNDYFNFGPSGAAIICFQCSRWKVYFSAHGSILSIGPATRHWVIGTTNRPERDSKLKQALGNAAQQSKRQRFILGT